MQIDKQEVVDLLRKEGKNEHAQQAIQDYQTRSTTSNTRKCSSRSSGSTPVSWPRRRSRGSFTRP